MSSLTDEVLNRLDPSTVQQIAGQLGIDPQQAQAAIQQAVPLVVGGLAQNASTDEGAAAVHNAAVDHAGLDIGSILGSVLGGNAGGVGSILGGLFGARQDQAAQGLGQASGLGAQNAGQLLAVLAPIVMSVLGGLSQRQGLDPGGLGGALAQESQTIRQSGAGRGLLGSILDQDGDGQLGLGDLLKVGSELFAARGRA